LRRQGFPSLPLFSFIMRLLLTLLVLFPPKPMSVGCILKRFFFLAVFLSSTPPPSGSSAGVFPDVFTHRKMVASSHSVLLDVTFLVFLATLLNFAPQIPSGHAELAGGFVPQSFCCAGVLSSTHHFPLFFLATTFKMG